MAKVVTIYNRIYVDYEEKNKRWHSFGNHNCTYTINNR